MPLKIKLFRVRIKNRKVVITLVGRRDDAALSVSLTACIPSTLGMLVYNERTSKVTRMSSSLTSLLIFESLFIASVESFVYEKKLDKMIVKKAMQDGVHKNPNEVITNLTGEVLSKEEIDVLTLGLKHGIAMRPKEDEMIPVAEAFYSRLSELKIIKDTHMATERVKMRYVHLPTI